MKCSNCNNEIELDNVVFSDYGKGRLCRRCYEWYDLDIKEIEYRFKILERRLNDGE